MTVKCYGCDRLVEAEGGKCPDCGRAIEMQKKARVLKASVEDFLLRQRVKRRKN